MKADKTLIIIGASCLALAALMLFQARWIKHSRALLEEQFNSRVAMALCSAVESIKEAPSSQEAKRSCAVVENQEQACCQELEALVGSPSMQKALNEAFAFYQIPLNYQAGIRTRNTPLDDIPPNSCSLQPILESDRHLLSVKFPDKEEYVLAKMGFMLGSSIVILIFISLVFLLANYTLLRQKRARERNTDFFNHMAHEFRTPLTNIGLAVKLLAKEQPALSGSRYFLAIQDENRQMMHQVEHILKLAELEEGAAALAREKVDLEALLRQSVADMGLRIQASGARVYFSSEISNPSIFGDPFHLRNAFRNLIDNALKYSRQDPEIFITISRNEDNILVNFKDNGVGIGPEGKPLIFKKFRRLACGGPGMEKGFGLGLSYVKRIVEMHKGAIRVASELNRGSQFVMALPELKQ